MGWGRREVVKKIGRWKEMERVGNEGVGRGRNVGERIRE